MKRRTGKRRLSRNNLCLLEEVQMFTIVQKRCLCLSLSFHVFFSLTVCVPSIFSPRTYDSDPTLLNYTTMTWGKDEEKQRAREWNQAEREREGDGKVGGRTRDPNGPIACQSKNRNRKEEEHHFSILERGEAESEELDTKNRTSFSSFLSTLSHSSIPLSISLLFPLLLEVFR